MKASAPSFDPYHKWLGIPPEEQPANHYRLLGVKLFEADADVIEAAADQRMVHLRSRQSGPNAALSQKLLNEMASARGELLDRDRRQAYDDALRLTLSPSPPPVSSAPAAEATGPIAPVFEIDRSRLPVRKRGWALPIAACAVALGLLAVLAILGMSLLSDDPPDIVQQPASTVEQQPPGPPSVPGPSAKVTPGDPTPPPPTPASTIPEQAPVQEGPAVADAAPENPPTVAAPEASSPLPTETTEPLVAERPAEEPPSSVEPASPATPPIEAEAPAVSVSSRLPVPTTEALDMERQAVKELYADRFAAARLPNEKAQLAAEILAQGLETLDNPTGKYVLLDTARRMAEQAGELELSLRACGHLGTTFEVDQLALKETALEACSKQVRRAVDWRPLADAAQALTDEAVAADAYPAAERLAKLTLEYARKTRDRERITRAVARAKELEELSVAYAEVQDAFERLESTPGDAASHLEVGKFLCFAKRDWNAGLAHLEQGSDAALADLAKRERQATLEPASWLQLADDWDGYAKQTEPPEREPLERRAAYWYRLALPMLSGLTKAKVEKQLSELPAEEAAVSSAVAGPPPERVKPGLWTPLVGVWKVTYTSGAMRTYEIDASGEVTLVETGQRATLANRGGVILLDFADGKLERLGVAGGALLIEHFDPATRFPNDPSQRGRGVREVRETLEDQGFLRLFEDEVGFPALLNEGGATVELEHKDVYSGLAAVKVTAGGRFSSALPGLRAKIREQPGPGEYRFLRFAWKSVGGDDLGIQLHTVDNDRARLPGAIWLRYHAGPAETFLNDVSIQVAKKAPRQWTLITVDLFEDYGEFTLTGLALTPNNGEYAVFDHIYLARERKDFEGLEKAVRRSSR